MHTKRNYSKSPAPKFDAVEDIKGHFGERWKVVSADMATVSDTRAFRIAASFGGVEGFPVEAWYDLYHGEGAYKAGVAAETPDAPSNARDPFNADIHAALLAEGFTWTAHEADWEDDGDGESGPHLTGGPAWDEYESADERIVIDHNGAAVHQEPRDLAQEAFESRMAGGEA